MSINFNVKPLLGAFNDMPGSVARELRKTMKQEGVEIQTLARHVHRHNTRSGSLNESIQERFDNESFTETVGFNPNTAVVNDPKRVGKKVDYGKYVHEGHGSWAPDKFLYEALEKREALIRENLEAAVRRGIEAAIK